MKKVITGALAAVCCLSLCGCGTKGAALVWTIILCALGGVLLLFGAWRMWQYLSYRKRMQKRGRKVRKPDLATLIIIGVAIVMIIVGLVIPGGERPEKPDTPGKDDETAQTEPATTEPTEPPVVYVPHKVATTDPANWGITWEIYKDGEKTASYNREEPIVFEDDDYFQRPGIATFRGNNYRNETGYGTADVVSKKLSIEWTATTGTLPGGVWSGSGWTGQPLMVQWDPQAKAAMNLYPEKQAKENLVEVIYPCLDGKIYFLDLDDGSATRDPLDIGLCFKGAGALDPRGYPLLYVGTGDVNYYGDRPKAYIISLIDGKILYRFGVDDPLSLRQDNGNWCAFDSSPLVDAQTDTLIWPGENGILYTMTLNTNYDPANKVMDVQPDNHVVTRYNTSRSNSDTYWLGYEASVSVCEGYLYVSENGGMFFCIDLNTMELVWAQDTCDDSNASPVFERTGEDSGAIYTAPSLHWTKDEYDSGEIKLYKLDAITGQVLWSKPYNVFTVSGVSGGVQSTMLLGREGTTLEGMLYCTISRLPYLYTGQLVALDKNTGEQKWVMDMDNYTWSSPVAFYGADGTGYLAVADYAGYLYLIDGVTGEILDTIQIGSLVEATPAIFGNKLVLGTRDEKIVCVEVS